MNDHLVLLMTKMWSIFVFLTKKKFDTFEALRQIFKIAVFASFNEKKWQSIYYIEGEKTLKSQCI